VFRVCQHFQLHLVYREIQDHLQDLLVRLLQWDRMDQQLLSFHSVQRYL